MSENRKQILDMLASGKITADEADRLLGALGNETKGNSNQEPTIKPKPKYLRVVVESDKSHSGEHGPTRVNIRVPMQLLRAGVRLASLIPKHAQDHVDDALKEHGLKVELSQLKPENLEELIESMSELTVDVDEKSNRVKIFCE